MKYSCARLAPKHDVADAEAAEQWLRKEADEAGIAGSGIKMSGSNSGAGLRTTLVSRCWRLHVGDWLAIVHTLNRDLHERLQHLVGVQSERGRSQKKHPAIDGIGIIVRVLL